MNDSESLLPFLSPSLEESFHSSSDGSFVKEMSAMSLYNQILAYIEGDNAPAADTVCMSEANHSSESLDAHSPPEPLPKDRDNNGGNDSDKNNDEESHANESLPKDESASSPDSLVKSDEVNDEENDSGHDDESHGSNEDGLITGGKLLSETVDNLTGGGMGKKESVKTPPPVKKDVDPNLFEGGNANGNVNGNVEAKMNENGVRGRYTEFLHRLRTPKLFSGGSVKHASESSHESLSKDSLRSCDESHASETADTTLDGGNIDVLPVFPYLIRY